MWPEATRRPLRRVIANVTDIPPQPDHFRKKSCVRAYFYGIFRTLPQPSGSGCRPGTGAPAGLF
jgi:hypothetical protein